MPDELRWEYGTRYSAAFSLAILAAITAGLVSFALASIASGSFGPGRFQEVGINILLFSGVVFLQTLIPSFIAGLVVARPYRR
jgi:fructose-specific phosphotransferase system IIC component